MTKQKKAKMYKAPILFLIILVLFIFIGYIMKDKKYMTYINNSKLKNKGYDENQIKEIIDSNYTSYALKHEYNEYFTILIKEKDFNIDYFDAYVDYINNNKTANISDVIFLVNNDITYTYSETLLSIVKEKYFLKTRLERYMNYIKKYPSLSTSKVVSYVNCNLDYDYYTNIESSDESLKTLIISNKYYKLDEDYSLDLVEIDSDYTRVKGAMLNKETLEAFKKLSDAAKLEGLSILNQSAYRSYSTQEKLYNNYLKKYGQEWTDEWSARPGHSEHQTGLALDVLTKDNNSLGDFESTKEFTWMKENSYKYGFILRYPEDGKLKTGYGYEPWHYRYVGIEVATKIYNENITYDEYYTYYILKR